ncbi:MAG TPA: hypothetical protein VF277_07790 [Steroidobacteraceae bacterium]
MSRLSDSLRRLADRLAGRAPSVEDERLVALFQNRAELKKELSALDDERHRLLDRLKLQEGATMRVQEQYDALEQYLGRPDEGFKCLVYFQLRSVWRAAARRLDHFGTELHRQQKDRERKAQLADFDRDRRARASDVERELVEARILADQLQAEQTLATQRLEGMHGFWNYFRRRKLDEEILVRAARIESSLTDVTDLSDQVHAIAMEAPPTFEGLSVDGRRAVNLAVIAYAEWLCERLSAGGVAGLARETTLRRVFESGYGSRDECLALMQVAARAITDLDNIADDLVDIKSRTDRMRRTASYRSEADVIPMSDSVGTTADATRRVHPVPNVLIEEYWDVYKALVR